MLRGSRGSSKGTRLKLESQNDEAFLTGRRTSQEREKQIKTPLRKDQSGGAPKIRGTRTKAQK